MPGIKAFTHLHDLPVRIPIFPLAGALLLPRTAVVGENLAEMPAADVEGLGAEE